MFVQNGDAVEHGTGPGQEEMSEMNLLFCSSSYDIRLNKRIRATFNHRECVTTQMFQAVGNPLHTEGGYRIPYFLDESLINSEINLTLDKSPEQAPVKHMFKCVASAYKTQKLLMLLYGKTRLLSKKMPPSNLTLLTPEM
ncbi:unnamed protein product [Enterobius vermicularis]|uniref:PAZ domain-containing protein n=1 Tax=Enterobius vermicularis TaxID=51028 RepID=A0A0N4VGK9_ENTVE|nr:unnamed protein product [Enterobius vermicularis]